MSPIPDNEVTLMFDPRDNVWHPTVVLYLTPEYIDVICMRALDTRSHAFHYIYPYHLTPEYVNLMAWALAN